MNVFRRVNFRMLITAALLAAPASTLYAQQPASKGPPNALQGFSQNRDQPVHIKSASLDVRDKDKVATFNGDVKVVQGDTTMKCKSLVVFYEQDSEENQGAAKTPTMRAATPGPGGEERIKRPEARGSVVVTQNDHTATGDVGIFDMKVNTVTLTGKKVVMTKGQKVMVGDTLVVDLTSGFSQVKGREGVSMLLDKAPDARTGAPRP